MRLVQKLWIGIAMLCLSFTASAYDFEIDGICYDVINAEELTCGVRTTKSLDCSKEIVIPSQVSYNGQNFTVTRIFARAFYKTKIENITLPSTCTIIEAEAFCDCTSLTEITIPEGVNYFATAAFRGCSFLKKVILPKSLLSTSEELFSGCSSLSEITIPENLSFIDRFTFRNCSSLTEIKIPKNVKWLGDSAFLDCSALRSVYFLDAEKIITIRNFVFRNDDINYVYIGRNLEIGQFTNFIDAVDSLEIGSKVTKTEIPNFIAKLNIHPAKVPLEFGEIQNTDWYKTIKLGRNLSGSYINFDFHDCQSSLEIGEYVTDVSNIRFRCSQALDTILIKASIPPICIDETFLRIENGFKNSKVKVPLGTLNAYKSAEGWKNFWNIEECDFSGVEAIEEDNALSCVADNGDIRIDNKDENSLVRVYNIQGSVLAETSESVVNNLPKGLYIVTVENKSFKVSLR